MNRPDKGAVRGEIALCLPFMGNQRDRARMVGRGSLLQDARRFHASSRAGGSDTMPAAECAAWAILYRSAYYGTLRITPGLRKIA